MSEVPPQTPAPAQLRLLLLTALTMVAFAANSVLNRLALADGLIGPVEFGAVRLMSGAAMLAALVLLRRQPLQLWRPERLAGVLSLTVYVFGFSLAYVTLDAGAGALILFGGVQVTMFAGALSAGERVPGTRWAGAALALSGLGWLLWPGGEVPANLIWAGMMTAAAIGWGVYSLTGRAARDPLGATAANFILAAPVGVALVLVLPVPSGAVLHPAGLAYAVVSGALTSGLGYALWYSVLPDLGASRAAVAQLTVPVIALLGGVVFLNEALSLRFAVASALVLGGVAISFRR